MFQFVWIFLCVHDNSIGFMSPCTVRKSSTAPILLSEKTEKNWKKKCPELCRYDYCLPSRDILQIYKIDAGLYYVCGRGRQRNGRTFPIGVTTRRWSQPVWHPSKNEQVVRHAPLYMSCHQCQSPIMNFSVRARKHFWLLPICVHCACFFVFCELLPSSRLLVAMLEPR